MPEDAGSVASAGLDVVRCGEVEELYRLKSMIRSMRNSVTLSDVLAPDCPLIYVNEAFERMTGYSSAEAIGRNCRFLQGEDRSQPGIDELRSAMRDGRTVEVLLRNYRKDGTMFWNEVSMSPVFDRSGRLTHFAGFQNDVTQRVEQEQALLHRAFHDPLTGAANRGLMMDRLTQVVSGACREGKMAAVLYFDLNRFKEVNDRYGHEAGDTLLCAVYQRLSSGMRAEETLARVGGDEFVAILQGLTNYGTALMVKQRLLERLREPVLLGGRQYIPSVSTGIAQFPRDAETPEALLKFADCNMYVEKATHHGRDRADWNTSEMPNTLEELPNELLDPLKRALRTEMLS